MIAVFISLLTAIRIITYSRIGSNHKMVEVEELKKAVKVYIERKAPGLIYVLDGIVRQCCGRKFVDMIFMSPSTLLYCLSKVYDRNSIKILVKNLIIKPIAQKLHKEHLEDRLFELFLLSDLEFQKMLKKLGIEYAT